MGDTLPSFDSSNNYQTATISTNATLPNDNKIENKPTVADTSDATKDIHLTRYGLGAGSEYRLAWMIGGKAIDPRSPFPNTITHLMCSEADIHLQLESGGKGQEKNKTRLNFVTGFCVGGTSDHTDASSFGLKLPEEGLLAIVAKEIAPNVNREITLQSIELGMEAESEGSHYFNQHILMAQFFAGARLGMETRIRKITDFASTGTEAWQDERKYLWAEVFGGLKPLSFQYSHLQVSTVMGAFIGGGVNPDGHGSFLRAGLTLGGSLSGYF